MNEHHLFHEVSAVTEYTVALSFVKAFFLFSSLGHQKTGFANIE